MVKLLEIMAKKLFFVFLVFMCSKNLLTLCATTETETSSEEVTTTSEASSEEDAPVSSETESNADLTIQDALVLETHFITTEDGYILTLRRKPGPPGSVPVLVQHGLFATSDCFIISNKSLVRALSDKGYDVWLGNARGTTFSKKHKTLSTSDPEFWNFTWHEQGVYDVPAMINYITELKNDNLFFVGHSMAGEDFAVMAIERPDVAKKVKAAMLLAPSVYVYNMRSLTYVIAPYWSAIQKIVTALGFQEIVPRNLFFNLFAKYICGSVILRHPICANILFFFGGVNSEQLDDNLLTDIYYMFPGGTSIKLYTHFLQQIHVNEFRKFDYGTEGNLIMYNSSVPPNYNLSTIQTPTAVFYSKNDWLVHENDSLHFYEQLPNKLGSFNVDDAFTHFDLVWGKDIPQLVNAKVLDVMAVMN